MKIHLALLLVFLPVAAGHAADNAPSSGEHAAQAVRPLSAKELAGRVGDIARSRDMGAKEKEARISALVQDAVMDAIAHLKTPGEMLETALKIATVAAAAAPQFTDAIAGAILAIPSIAAIDGAAARIQSAVVDAATRAAGAEFSSNKPKRPRNPEFGGGNGDTVVSRYR